ncbi:MAG: helix-turn-helix domain-containing protein [Candidatus Scatosoma sp.]
MKDIKIMPLGEALMYVRKSNKQYSSREKLSQATGISKWMLTRYEREGNLPPMSDWIKICDALSNEELRQMGVAQIEYKRTHPNVKICFADNTTCWKCKQTMCSVYGLVDGHPISPDFFNEEMLEISRKKGAILTERRSGVTGEIHLVNTCPHCGAFIGEFYLHDLWYGETETISVQDVKDFIRDEE